MNSNTVITISRQYGCGGRELAEILAKKLNVKLYDRQIVHIAAAKLGINDLLAKVTNFQLKTWWLFVILQKNREYKLSKKEKINEHS